MQVIAANEIFNIKKMRIFSLLKALIDRAFAEDNFMFSIDS